MDTAVASRRIGVLEQLAVGSDRPKAAQLREIFDTVEAAIAHGVTHAALVQALATTGLEFTLGSFRTTLGRIRRMRRDQQELAGQVALPVADVAAVDRGGQQLAKSASTALASRPGVSSRPATSTDKTIRSTDVVDQVAVRSDSELPPDWLTSTQLTRDQLKRLSAAQREARRKVLDQVIRETYFRSPYSGLRLGGTVPPGSGGCASDASGIPAESGAAIADR